MKARSLLLMLALLACADVYGAETEGEVSVQRPARIRLFGQNGVSLVMFTNARCKGEYDEEIEGSGSVSHNFRAMVGKKRPNETIGMPATESTRNLASREGFLASPYYLEYPLVPGQPVLLKANIIDAAAGYRCDKGRGVQIAFVPEPGVDYEGDMSRNFRDGICSVGINRIDDAGALTPVSAGPLPPAKCAADAAGPVVPPMMVMLFEPGRVQYRLGETGADLEELDDDDDSIEDFEEAMEDAPLPSGVGLCIVAGEDAKTSPLGKKIPELLRAHDKQVQVIRGSTEALVAEWGLTEERPLTFPLAEYYCRSIAEHR